MRAAACLLLSATASWAGVETWTVDDATTGLLVRDTRAPIVAVQVDFPAGEWSGWARDADLDTALRLSLYDRDGELRRRADRESIYLSLGVGPRSARAQLWCLADDLDEAVALLRDVLTNDDLDRAEARRWKQEARIAWQGSQKDVQFRARQATARLLFSPDDPRRARYERPQRVQTNTGKLREIRDALIRLPGRRIGFAGDIDRERAEAIARELLPPASDAPPDVDLSLALQPPRALAERDDVTVRVPRLTQVYFGLVRESVPMDAPDYPAFLLANHVLGGHFYSRLYVALRHEGGETYGAFARGEGDTVPGPFTAASFTRTDNAGHALEKMRDTLRVFRDDGITEEERRDAASYLLGKAPFERQTPSQILARRMSERRLGLPDGFFDELARRAAELPLDRVNAFIAGYYDPDRLRLARVAPKGAAIGP